MKIRRISGAGCLLFAIIALAIVSIIGNFSLAVLRLLFRTPLGLVALGLILFYLWRNRSRTTTHIGRSVRSEEYVTLEDDPDIEHIIDE